MDTTCSSDGAFAPTVKAIQTHKGARRISARSELRRMDYDAGRRQLVAELTDLNKRLNVSYMRARDENMFKSQFIGMIAHDLRSPLSALLVHADLGMKQASNPPADLCSFASRFENIIRVATRMADLIETTLQKVREDDARLRPEFHPVDLAALTRIALEANQPEAARKSIEVRLVDEGPTRCRGDAGLLVPAIDNLLSNAIKYTHLGGAVTVTVRPARDHCEVVVVDNGQGMTKGDLKRVFGRFQTLSARPTGGENSTGLGLSNVREILAAHGGTATAESPGPGNGSTFRLILPAAG